MQLDGDDDLQVLDRRAEIVERRRPSSVAPCVGPNDGVEVHGHSVAPVAP